MDIKDIELGAKLRVIRLTNGYGNDRWGFKPGDEVTVIKDRFSDVADGHVAVERGPNGMIGIFAPADLMQDPVVGDRVRAHDFTNVGEVRIMGRGPSYYEGVIRAVAKDPHQDCDRYEIAVDRQVIDGREAAIGSDEVVCPSVNGTVGTVSGVLFRVEKI